VTPENVADLIRALVMVDRAEKKLRGLALPYDPTRSLANVHEKLEGCLGSLIRTEQNDLYTAGSALYDEWWGSRWDEDVALDEKRTAALTANNLTIN